MPTIIDSSQFGKNLNSFAHKGRVKCGRICYFTTAHQLYKLTEVILIDSQDEIDLCVSIEIVKDDSGNEDCFSSIIDELEELDQTESEIVSFLLPKINQANNTTIGRIALKKNSIATYSGKYEDAMQVVAVKVKREYQQRGIVTSSYLCLLNWYDHLMSDDYQTVGGARIWANSLSVIVDVQVYDVANECYYGVLHPGGVSHTGFVPWNSGNASNLHGWHPNALRENPKKFIVLVISNEYTVEIGYPV